MTSANAGPALSWRQRPAAQRILCPLRTNGRRLVAGVRTPLPLRDAMVGLRRRAGGSPCRVMGGRHQRRRDARRDTNAGAPRPRPVLVRLLPGEGARRPGGHYCDVKCEAELCLAPDRACGSSSGSSRCLGAAARPCGAHSPAESVARLAGMAGDWAVSRVSLERMAMIAAARRCWRRVARASSRRLERRPSVCGRQGGRPASRGRSLVRRR